MHELTLRADTVVGLRLAIHDLDLMMNPGEFDAEEVVDPRLVAAADAIAEISGIGPNAPARRGRKPKAAGAVGASAHPAPAGEAQGAEAPAEGSAVEGAVGPLPDASDSLQPEAAAEDHLEGDSQAAELRPAAVGAASEEVVPTAEEITELTKQVAARTSFKTVQAIFGDFKIKRFGELDASQYPAFKAALEEKLAA